MTTCPHKPAYPPLESVPTFEEAWSHCSLTEGDEKVAKSRALTSVDGSTTRIDSAYWSNLSAEQKCAVIAHERAHPEIGMGVDCEGCADKVGGYYMRAWGYCPAIVRSSYATLRVGREQDHGHIADNAAEGAAVAERALAGRGLLGRPSAFVSASLSASRIAATKPALANPAPIKPTSPAVNVAVGETSSPALVQSPGANQALPPTDPGGPATAAESGPPSVDASTGASTTAPSDLAGDAVAFVLGNDARPHATKIFIAAGVAAVVAIILVVIVRRK